MSGRAYRIEIARAARRALLALPAEASARIETKIASLARAPRPRGAIKLAGVEELYRLRVGDYRIVYRVHDRALMILVVDVGHRREAYRR